jgi:phosphate transport system substrate-binding protein
MNAISGLIVGCGLACSFATTAAAGILIIPGSGGPEYVLNELANAFNRQQKLHQVVIPPSTGTAGAIRDVIAGTAHIGRIGRPLNERERAMGLTHHPFGRDPVAFVGGAGVSVQYVTRQQMLDVYAGKLTNWRELGGKSQPIRAIGREETDGSRQAIGRDMRAFARMTFHDSVKVVHLDPQMIELLDRYPTSIGFINRSALSAAKTKLVVLSLDSIEPNAANLSTKRYTISAEFGLIHKPGALTEAGRSFLAFVESPVGAGILRANGVLLDTAIDKAGIARNGNSK